MTRNLSLSLLIVALVSGCDRSDLDDHAHDDEHSHGDENSFAFTHYTDQTELFVEFPALVVGMESQALPTSTSSPVIGPESASAVVNVGSGVPPAKLIVTELGDTTSTRGRVTPPS